MRAGKLRHYVTIEKPREHDQRNELGELVAPWSAVADVWASVEPLSARESFQAGQAMSTATHRITIRYRSDVSTANRIKYVDGGRTRYFYFDGALTSPDEMREVLTGTAQERSK